MSESLVEYLRRQADPGVPLHPNLQRRISEAADLIEMLRAERDEWMRKAGQYHAELERQMRPEVGGA